MAADLPTEFDVVVLGSGMPESIVAAACSRIGQAVLHIDRNEYYSGDWASFTLQGIEKWAKQHQEPSEDVQRPAVDESSLLEGDEALIQLPLDCTNFSQIDLTFHVEEGEDIEDSKLAKTKLGVQTQPLNIKDIPSDNCDKTEATSEPVSDSSVANTETTEQHISEEIKKVTINNENTETKDDSNESVGETRDNETAKGDNNKDETKGDNKVETNINCDEKTCDNKSDAETPDSLKSANEPAPEVAETEQTPTVKPTSEETQSPEVAETEQTPTVKPTSEETQSPEVAETEQTPTANPTSEETQSPKWTIKRLKSEWRKFNLDLSPKVIYSGGDMVELLISSDIAKYCEFKTITRMLTLLNGALEKVPCSRADVFSSKKVSMIEKRMLMKFLQFCMEYEKKAEEISDFMQKPFTEFLAHKKLTANVKHYIQHSIAMATDSTTTEEGLKQMGKFIKSIGRYGNTAFLWSLYGSGELPQSFCRMCAVFGGLYCLRMPASSMVVDKENRCTGIITGEGQKIKCKWLIMESSYAPPHFIAEDSTRILSRAILMTDKPLLPTDQQEISLMCLPCPDDGDRPIVVLELPPTSQACPKDTYIFHLTRKGSANGTPEKDLMYAVDKLFKRESDQCDETDQSSDKPTILWSLYFSQRDMSTVCPTDRVPSNVILMSGPGPEIDIDRPVREAKEVFKRILPDEEFLPKAPNPEDIIYVDDTEAQVAEDGSQSEFKDTDSQSETSVTDKPTDEDQAGSNQSDASTTDKEADGNQTDACKGKLTNEMEACDSQLDPSTIDKQNSQQEAGNNQADASTTDKETNEKKDMESVDLNKDKSGDGIANEEDTVDK